jgi:sortase A
MSDDVTELADGSSAPDARVRHARSRMSTADRVRFVLRGIGQTLITAGLVVLLFVVYEVYVTNFFAHQAQSKVHHALEQEWARGDNPLLPLPNGGSSTIPLGTGIANVYIPRFGRDYAWTIVEGVNSGDLEKGPGHYPGTAAPGKVGNFAVAGHRVGKGEPFLNLDKLRPGDPVIIETKANWYVYRVKGKPSDITAKDADGIPGREIVSPSAGEVVLPVPDKPGAKPTEKLMTMTTCTPKFTAAKRMIVYAKWQQTLKRSPKGGKPPAITALYTQGGS